jgi:hypothetical protein
MMSEAMEEIEAQAGAMLAVAAVAAVSYPLVAGGAAGVTQAMEPMDLALLAGTEEKAAAVDTLIAFQAGAGATERTKEIHSWM